MKNLKLLVCVFTGCLLVTSIFAVLPALSQQPPLYTSTMYVGTIGQPKNVDPSQAYDTASGELIQNVYDSILEFGSQGTNTANKPVPTVPSNRSVNVGTNVAMLGQTADIPGVCSMPQVTSYSNGSSRWVFQVNTNLVFQPWYAANGTLITGEHMTAQDVVYYWQRFFVQDSHNSPEWMVLGPAFDLGNFDPYQVGSGPSLGGNESYVASLITSFISGFSNATGQYVQMYFQYPAIGMYDILAATWSSIPPMQWSIDHGCWNGMFYLGWSADFRRYPNDLFTPLDVHTTAHGNAAGSLYPASAEPAMDGTGPYSFTYWNQATEEWRIDAFAQCVSHPWPGPYDVAGSNPSEAAPTTAIETGVNTWPTRKMMFLAGDFDMAVVERANMYDLLVDTSHPYSPISGITLYYNIPTLQTNAIFFTFNINASSKWMPIVNGVADPTVFSDIHVRWAFCQALNMSAYISGAWYGEALHPSSFWALGLTPTARQNTAITPWDINEAWVYGNLTAAGITTFSMTFLYNTGITQGQIAVQSIANVFADINAKYGTHYDVTVTSEDWPTYLSDAAGSNLPFFITGWLADFSDADDFIVPFMASWGFFGSRQAYSNSTIDSQIHAEEVLGNTPASPARCAIMQELQYEYYQQAISLPTVQPTLRHWQRDWVYGYYANQLYQGNYYQDLYKKAANLPPPSSTSVTCSPTSAAAGSIVNCTATVSGSSPTGTVTWTTSSNGTGYFSQSVCTLSSGSCSTSYVDNNTGCVTLTASYSGDSNNGPSNGSTTLTVFVNITSGTNVTVTPTNNLELTFASVTAAGIVVASETPTVPAPPLDLVGEYYDIKVTASFVGNVTVSLAFDGSNMTTQQKSSLRMMQYTPIPGDINGDGTVDILDAILLSNAFGVTPSSSSWNPNADINGDGTVNILDAILLSNNFSQTHTWINITVYVNATSNIVYGQTTHFSYIGIH